MMMALTKTEFKEDFDWVVMTVGKYFSLCRRHPRATTKELVEETAINYCIRENTNCMIELMGNQLWAVQNNFNTMEKFYPILKEGKTVHDMEQIEHIKALEEALKGVGSLLPDKGSGSLH